MQCEIVLKQRCHSYISEMRNFEYALKYFKHKKYSAFYRWKKNGKVLIILNLGNKMCFFDNVLPTSAYI